MINETDLVAFEYYNKEEEPGGDWMEDPRLMSPQQMVRAYSVKAGQPLDPDLYYTLIQEEYKEWQDEAQWYTGTGDDEVKELKELADLVYVLYGYSEAMGWNLDEALLRVHENNMARMVQDDGTIMRREDGKIIKNPNTPKVNLEDCV